MALLLLTHERVLTRRDDVLVARQVVLEFLEPVSSQKLFSEVLG